MSLIVITRFQLVDGLVNYQFKIDKYSYYQKQLIVAFAKSEGHIDIKKYLCSSYKWQCDNID